LETSVADEQNMVFDIKQHCLKINIFKYRSSCTW